ncbi:hypothetical protein DENIS_4813 [Desulfonema ishimotonii]|uniref:Alginate export domain-containing protein n=1 Tax=Desulfonema ishimotonii TaxID=45657 RepID=A0A401G3X6_9BACT|nr:hypothetical protein [Desulfonema ishimotonii]GBC63815.1 hypothetical protein DENIS_4813 [Desulfonema ishimotonii]
MKKFTVLALAAVMVVALTVPAWALESEFGGYWRTRAFTQQNFTGEDDSEAQDLTRVDTRTRLYYTAIFNENLKFVNKFEMDAVWGDDSSYGDIGTDGISVEVKNSYADFNLGPVNMKIGAQGYVMGRGFLFDDDFAGAVVTYEGETFKIPFIWVKAYEGGIGKDANDFDADYYAINPSFTVADGMFTINPFFLYLYADKAGGDNGWDFLGDREEAKMYYAGLNLDVALDNASIWFTGIYNGGDADADQDALEDLDFDEFDGGYLLALGGNVNMNFGDIHGQVFYATGNDPDDEDSEAFIGPKGQSYYWSEIMGYGIFDNQTSANAPADAISNIMAANLGATVKPMDKLSITLDVWYAALVEDNDAGEDKLGTEVDLKVTYELVEGLNLDVVGAYLFADDGTYAGDNDADPYEIGTRLSLKF